MKWLEDNGFENTYTLTRKNETVEEIDSRTTLKTEDYLRGLYGADSNSVRIMVLHSILMGYKFYEKGYFRDAIREVLKPLKHKAEKSIRKLELRNTAIDIIDDLKRDETRQQSLYDYYDRLLDGVKRKDKKHNFQIGPRLTNRSSAKGFYEATKVSDLLKFIKVDTRSEDTVRTIHSAKGTEFKNVMVHFEKLKDFEKYVFTAYTCLDADEDDARIYYVGFSRAIECLFINIPEIGSDTLTHLREINVDYEILV
jgi:DNA helicase-2/ATP-dependent DNA helicase PcrA